MWGYTIVVIWDGFWCCMGQELMERWDLMVIRLKNVAMMQKNCSGKKKVGARG